MEQTPNQGAGTPTRMRARTLAAIAAVLVVLFGAAFVVGYLPRRERIRQSVLAAEEGSGNVPTVVVATARATPKTSQLVLPGNVQPITETPILARAEGYLVKRYVDIGDRVKAGQLLAELDTPDLDQQVQQAQAAVQQTRAALAQTQATVQQEQANAALAEVTAKRNNTLVARGVLSKQEGDDSTAAYRAQEAGVAAGEANVRAARQNVDAVQANLRRLRDMQSFKQVRAPFSGIVTLRNVDTGALINSGSTLLFRLAQTDTLRVFINVPQSDFAGLSVGSPAVVTVQELPGRQFSAKVTRVANSLDVATRTMLTEVQIPNSTNTLLPGMYAEVQLSVRRVHPAAIVPGEAVVVRPSGTMAAVVDKDERVHFQPISIGRDYGAFVEVLSGVEAGDRVVINPSDAVRDGVLVRPTPYQTSPPNGRGNVKSPV